MPFERENGKFQAVGNGGWAGVISYPHMALALSRGYATASTDSGHDTPGAGLALAPGEAERVCLSPEPLVGLSLPWAKNLLFARPGSPTGSIR